ncbi:MAG: TonB-dependent receptor [Bacteroidota bacterium]|nr:TonB-dependent receptor [Bacteroidota bacterium]
MKKLYFFALLLMQLSSYAQDHIIQGIVSDENDEGLPGATIIIKGTTIGTVTDINGEFSLKAFPDTLIIVSYSGYERQEISIDNQTILNIKLTPDVETLKEVVVVGYGAQEKINITGSVATIKQEELVTVPVANTSNLIAGKVPGVMTRQNSGLPGGENTQIRIRGFSQAPLVLVDGVQMDFSRVDQNDIASISVLKDASAAVYGARAGNGVILVTTKRGEEGAPKISFNSSFTSQSATSFLKHVTPSQYVELIREANLNDFSDADATFTEEDVRNYEEGIEGYEGGNWIDALIKNNAPMQQYNLNISGGTDNVKYFSSFGYVDQESFFRSRDFDYKRYNIRSNIDINLNENLSLGVDMSYRQDIRERPSKNALSDIWIDLSTAQPIYPTSLPDGVTPPDPSKPFVSYSGSTTGNRNPIARSSRNIFGTYDRFDNTFRSKIGLSYKIPGVKGLELGANMNIQVLDRSEKSFRNPYNVYRYSQPDQTFTLEGVGNGISSISDSQFRRTMLYPLLSAKYDRNFGSHDLKVLVLAEQTRRSYSRFSATRKNLFTTSIPELFIGSENEQTNDGSSGSDMGRKSMVARINYKFKDRYLFESTFRADGNVLFAPDNRWGYFPSFSLGWIASEEPFFSASENISLKLRASYSQMGNDSANGIRGFDYLAGYQSQNIYLFGQNISNNTIRTLGEVNPFLSWEVISMYNLGLEGTFLQGRLQVELDYFYRKRENILSNDQKSVAREGGFNLPLTNINVSDDRGIELSAIFQQNLGDFRISLAPNFAIGKEKFVVRNDLEKFTDPDYIRIYGREGQWVNRRFGYLSDGIFMSQDEINNHPTIQDGNGNLTLRPGDIKYIDLDNNDTINFRDQDVIGYASNMPEITYGMGVNIKYKNLQLSTGFQGASKFSIYINGPAANMFNNGSIPLAYQYRYAWQPHPDNPNVNINPEAMLPSASLSSSTNNSKVSDFWLRDVRYLRVKNINLSYNIPEKTFKKIGLKSTQVYVSSENLTSWTNLGIYKNTFDPEFDPGTQATRRYPITRSYTVGLRVLF